MQHATGPQDWKNSIVFFLNGTKVEIENVDPSLSVAEYLRGSLGLTATKIGCGQGLCGNHRSLSPPVYLGTLFFRSP